MISKIQRDFLALFKCIYEVCADDLQNFTEEKIKSKCPSGLFTDFLKENKHHLYHHWDNAKVSCCECSTDGYDIPKTATMYKEIFDKLYTVDNSFQPPREHSIRKGKIVIRTCICKYTERMIKLTAIDIFTLNVFLFNLDLISPDEKSLLEDLMSVLINVCNAFKTHIFSETELSTLWSSFTRVASTMNDNNKKYVSILNIAIKATKKSSLSDEEIAELMKKIDSVNNVCYLFHDILHRKHLIYKCHHLALNEKNIYTLYNILLF